MNKFPSQESLKVHFPKDFNGLPVISNWFPSLSIDFLKISIDYLKHEGLK